MPVPQRAAHAGAGLCGRHPAGREQRCETDQAEQWVACAAKRLYPRDRAEGRHTVNGSGDGKRRPHRQADAVLLLCHLWFQAHHAPGKSASEKPDLCEPDAQRRGAGFKDLAATVNGDYFAIPPLKLRGAVKYRHLRWQRRHALCGHHAQHRSEAGIPAQRLPHQQLPLRRLVHCGQRRPAAVERPAVRQRLRLGVCRLPPAEAAARMTGQLA